MKTLIVTSRTTFVPDNYDALIIGLAARPEVHGLLVFDNRSLEHVKTAAALTALGARRLGFHLLRNHLGGSHQRRVAAYHRAGKRVWTLRDINAPEALNLVAEEGIELILNARTRSIYREAILAAPPLGCINIHHGLLPQQRGTMCDLWALAAGEAAGFSVHYMTPQIDAGAIVTTVRVSKPGEKDYLAYLKRGAQVELAELTRLLGAFAAHGRLPGLPNATAAPVPHRRNPKPAAIRQMLQQGIRL